MECLEATERLLTVELVLDGFRRSVLAAKAAGGWKLPSDAAFSRLDAVLSRAKELRSLRLAAVQLGRLERIEIGADKVRLSYHGLQNVTSRRWFRQAPAFRVQKTATFNC